jgi:hypothetical protein
VDRHDLFAQDLMQQYPEETNGFSRAEVRAIWERVSADFAAGWLDPDQVEGLVAQEFLEARRRREEGKPR